MKVIEWWLYKNDKPIKKLSGIDVLALIYAQDTTKAMKQLGGDQVINVFKGGKNGLGN